MDMLSAAVVLIVPVLLIGALGAAASIWGVDSRSTLNNDHNR
jgi:hypothetical protein